VTQFTGIDKAEIGRLQQAVRDIEAMFAAGTALTGSANTMVLEFILAQSKKRIAELEHVEESLVTEERQRSVVELAAAYKAEKELALNAEERRQYAEFLQKEHFTKSDFDSLEKFYGSAWDRLSEDGKAEMSHRVWEGVRRDEYEFSELPDIVKEKEAKRLRTELGWERPNPELLKIPEGDRREFIEAWDGKDKQRAYEVLDRKAFADHVSLTAKSVSASTLAMSKESAQTAQKQESASAPRAETKGNAAGTEDFALGDVKLVSTSGTETPAPLKGKAVSSSTVAER